MYISYSLIGTNSIFIHNTDWCSAFKQLIS